MDKKINTILPLKITYLSLGNNCCHLITAADFPWKNTNLLEFQYMLLVDWKNILLMAFSSVQQDHFDATNIETLK